MVFGGGGVCACVCIWGGGVVCESLRMHTQQWRCVSMQSGPSADAAIWGNPGNTGENNHPSISDVGFGRTQGKGLSCLVHQDSILVSHPGLTKTPYLIHHPVDEHI